MLIYIVVSLQQRMCKRFALQTFYTLISERLKERFGRKNG